MNLRNNLIDWLNEHGENSFGLLEDLGIKVSKDDRYPNLFNFKYGSILADKTNLIVCACRGAVVEIIRNNGDQSPYFRLVAYAFDRFFNYGEPGAATIDWKTAKVFTKYDGSLIKLFFWNGDWIVSTSGSVGGASKVGDSDKSFEELFWEVFNDSDYNKEDLNPDHCYIFELCSLENKVVISYCPSIIRLLAVRDRTRDFEELPLEEFYETFDVAWSHLFGDPSVVTTGSHDIGLFYNLTGEDVVNAANSLGARNEGYVVCDINKNRIKIKSDLYCQLHRISGNGQPDFSELYLNDDLEEFLLHFPEYSEKFGNYVERISTYSSQAEIFIAENSTLNQKDFAQKLLSQHPEISGAVFNIRSGRVKDFAHYIENLTPRQLDRLLGI